MTNSETIFIADHQGMLEFGRALASRLERGDVVLLHGDLGAGKTTLTQGVAAGLGVQDPIQSPTFSLIAEHPAVDRNGEPVRLYHLDLYRLEDAEELEGIGYDQFISPEDAISVIEWPERAGDWLPERFWLLRIVHRRDGGRLIEQSLHSPDGGSA